MGQSALVAHGVHVAARPLLYSDHCVEHQFGLSTGTGGGPGGSDAPTAQPVSPLYPSGSMVTSAQFQKVSGYVARELAVT